VRDLHLRARQGIRVLLGRHVVRQIISVSGGIVVARILGPGPIGVYGIGLFVLTIFSLLADLGMRTALIRHPDPLSERQLGSCFLFHQTLAVVLALAMFLGADVIANLYASASAELAWVIRILAVDIYAQSWRMMSEVRLERELRYREFAVADVVGTTGNQIVAVSLVFAGLGAQSLAWALLTGSLLRTVLLFRASPWAVRPHLDPAAAREFVRSGVAIQANQLITLAPAWVTPTLVAALIGPQAVGLLTWAASLGRKPLEILENVVRVSAPHFARLQADLPEVERVLARYAVACLLLCGLWFSVLAVAAQDLVRLVYTEQWVPAVPALLIYAGAAMIGVVRWLASVALVGIGRVGRATRVSAVGSVVATAASVLLVLRFGFIGAPLGQLAGVAVATPLSLLGIRAGMGRILYREAAPVLPSMAVGIGVGALAMILPLHPSLRGPVVAGLMTIAYLVVAWRTAPAWLRVSLREERAALRSALRRDDPPTKSSWTR
jgi:O-antigen/teichoic acid export membrane protein